MLHWGPKSKSQVVCRHFVNILNTVNFVMSLAIKGVIDLLNIFVTETKTEHHLRLFGLLQRFVALVAVSAITALSTDKGLPIAGWWLMIEVFHPFDDRALLLLRLCHDCFHVKRLNAWWTTSNRFALHHFGIGIDTRVLFQFTATVPTCFVKHPCLYFCLLLTSYRLLLNLDLLQLLNKHFLMLR